MNEQAHWKRYVPSAVLPWTFERAKHLHRRAGFGATWAELQRDTAAGPDASISRLLDGTSRIDGQRDDFEEMARIIGDAAVGSGSENRLQAWWLYRILFTAHPLREKLTLMWHNHFATSNLKVRNLRLMYDQNLLFRDNAKSNFAQLLQGILHDAAMLTWLDASSNLANHPNENLARELLELFTLGVNRYTEADVRETARALTGWTVKRGQTKFHAPLHDDGLKTILGTSRHFDTDSLASLLLDHEATSLRLAWRLCDQFMGEGVVSGAAISELASGLRKHDLDTGWAVETILRSELFFSEANIGSRVLSPVEFVAGSVRSLELLDKPPSTLILAEWCTRLGQDLFRPPNVAGWAGGRNWLTSRTIIGRSNFAVALAWGELTAPASPPPYDSLLEKLGTRSQFEALLLSRSSSAPFVLEQDLKLPDYVAQLLSRPAALLG